VTNYDFWDHDVREYKDQRRFGVIKALDAAAVINKDVLFETLNRIDVIQKTTIYQGIMNVETGFF